MGKRRKKFGSSDLGANGEREVARLFETWWSSLEPDAKFKKTPASGGWSSPDVRGAFDVAGDLVTTAKQFPYCVEVKRRERWSLANFLRGGKSPVWGWWAQAKRQALEVNKIPLLVFRQNHDEWRFLMPDHAVHPQVDGEMRSFDRCMYGQGWIACGMLSDLLAVSPEDIVAYAEVPAQTPKVVL